MENYFFLLPGLTAHVPRLKYPNPHPTYIPNPNAHSPASIPPITILSKLLRRYLTLDKVNKGKKGRKEGKKERRKEVRKEGGNEEKKV